MKMQRGFSFFALIFFIAILSAVVSIALKILPPYMDFLTIADATKQTIEQPRVALLRQDVIMGKIDNQLSINNISLSEYEKDAISLRTEGGRLIADIDYSVQAPVFTSEEVEIVVDMHFVRTVEARATDE